LFSLPHLIARALQYGSPMDYGDNSKYLVDSYFYVYAPNIENPTWFEFFRDKGIAGAYEKFVVNGLFAVTEQLARGIGFHWFVLAIVTGVASFFVDGLKKLRPLGLYCLVFFSPLVLVWDVYHDARFIYGIMPAGVIIGSAGLIYLLRVLRWEPLVRLTVAAVLVSYLIFGNQKVDLFFFGED